MSLAALAASDAATYTMTVGISTLRAAAIAYGAAQGLPPAVVAAIADKLQAYALDEFDQARIVHVQAGVVEIRDDRP